MKPLKLTTLFFAVLFSFFVTNTFAQIKVFPSEQVQVGPLWSPSFPSTKQLFINGGLEVRESPGTAMFLQNYNNVYNGVVCDDPSIVSHFNYGGWVGTPNQAMFAVYTNQLFVSGIQVISDERLKMNIKPILSTTALQKILSLKAYTYDFNANRYKTADVKKQGILTTLGKNQIGFMAQEVNEVLPEAVKQDATTGDYSVNYVMIIPLLVEALKEQQQKILLLEAEIEALKKK